MLWKQNNRRTKEINEKVNRTQDFTWFGQLCLRHEAAEILLYLRILQGTTCLGGYLTFYITK